MTPPTSTPANPSDVESSKEDNTEGSGTSVVVALVTAIAAGISVLGFVAFFGGAIEWIRFDSAHLSGEEAVAVIPRSVLLTNGAIFLVPAVLIALGFVALLLVAEAISQRFWSDFRKIGPLRTRVERSQHEAEVKERIADRTEALADAERRRNQGLPAGETRSYVMRDRARADRQAANAARLAAGEGEIALEEEKHWNPELIDSRKAFIRQILVLFLYSVVGVYALFTVGGLSPLWGILLMIWIALAIGVYAHFSAGDRELRYTGSALHGLGRFVTALALVLGVSAILIALTPNQVRMIVLIGVVIAATMVSLAVLSISKYSFVWLALTAFFAVGVFEGFITYYRTRDTAKVEPAALLRTDRRPLYGFYVAQTSDRIYFGVRDHDVVRLVSTPRDQVSDLTVGRLLPKGHARAQAVALALGLCRETRTPGVALAEAEVAGGSPSTAAASSPPQPKCSADVVAGLHAKLKRLNERLGLQAGYRGRAANGRSVSFDARTKGHQPVDLLNWRFRGVPVVCRQGMTKISDHAAFTTEVIDGDFHAAHRMGGAQVSITGSFPSNREATGTLSIDGSVRGLTNCHTLFTWRATQQ